MRALGLATARHSLGPALRAFSASVAVAAGLLFGAGVSAIGGCDRLCESRSSLSTGNYAIDADERVSTNFTAADYALTLSDDRSTITERFRIGEKRYELTYAVTRAVRH